LHNVKCTYRAVNDLLPVFQKKLAVAQEIGEGKTMDERTDGEMRIIAPND
jgi:hypothetical protein